MPLQRYLAPGEEVVSQHGPFYATSFRVVRFEVRKDGREEARSLPYSSLETVELVTKPRHLLMILGTVMAILALPMWFYLVLTPIIMFVVGVGMVIVGGIGREAYYQLHARNMTAEEARLWRIPRRGSGQLVASIRYTIHDKLDF